METLCFWVNLLVGLCVRSSFAFLPPNYKQHASFQKPRPPQSQSSTPTVLEQQQQQQQVNTVGVTCHPDSLEIAIKADMFAVGAPVNSDELRLGVEHNDFCRATAASGDEYRIHVGLMDCGTKHWMTEDFLIYTNLLIYSPVASPSGVIRMDEAVIPIECQYERKYSLSSSSLVPTWIPFTATQAAVETLEFNLRLKTNDWLYERSSNIFHLGEPISIEASVRVGHHMGLRVFVSSCVATLYPDIYSDPRYVFIENGCLLDSQVAGSKAHFLPRTQDDKLQLVIDAFKFHNDDRGQLYITCHLNAVPVNDAEALNKACTFVNGRWRSADGNDYLCGYCQSQNEVTYTHSKPSSVAKPRGFGKPAESEPLWRSGLRSNLVLEQESRLGPMVILPSRKSGPSGPLPEDELPPALKKMRKTTLYGSEWRSGINKLDMEKEPIPDPQDLPEIDEKEDGGNGTDLMDGGDDGDDDDDDETEIESKDAAPLEKAGPEFKVKSLEVPLDDTTPAPSDDISTTPEFNVEETTMMPNVTTTKSDADTLDPKK